MAKTQQMANSKPSTSLRPSEADIRKAVVDYLRWTGWFVFYHLQGLGSYPGMPDIQAVRAGRTVYIELKRPGGRQRPDQVQFQADVEAAGGTYILARGVEDVEWLNEGKQAAVAQSPGGG